MGEDEIEVLDRIIVSYQMVNDVTDLKPYQNLDGPDSKEVVGGITPFTRGIKSINRRYGSQNNLEDTGQTLYDLMSTGTIALYNDDIRAAFHNNFL